MKSGVLIPTPVQKVSHPLFDDKGVHLYVKRDDMIHPWISGNKWRKLKYHISFFQESDYDHMITFGGAFSNHIYAFAHMCRIYGLKGAVIVRGEEDLLNPTIQSVIKCGVHIHYVNRSEYRMKERSCVIAEIIDSYQYPLIIPEGGSSAMARKGIHELGVEIDQEQQDFNVIAIAAGTGCTSGCLIERLGPNQKFEVYSALKGDFMRDEIKKWAGNNNQWEVFQDDCFGGYGKVNRELVDFINEFYELTGIPLDPIYNGKLVYRLVQRLQDQQYPEGSSILWVHTGGLQGIKGFNYRWKNKYSIVDP